MSTTIINAIINLYNHHDNRLVNKTSGNNRMNNMGYALEDYVKDMYANTFSLPNGQSRTVALGRVFSWLGNANNPPDAMVRGGDAIEVKKIESIGASIQLNSSYPKQTLLATNNLVSDGCRTIEQWTEKDIVYAIGAAKDGMLKTLCLVYGLDYCANDNCYNSLLEIIRNGTYDIGEVDFAETNEIARVNRVDPLGITSLRVRGMWIIENPLRVFDYVYRPDSTCGFNFMCIINEAKWNRINNVSELLTFAQQHRDLTISDISVRNPDNPADLRNAKLISFKF